MNKAKIIQKLRRVMLDEISFDTDIEQEQDILSALEDNDLDNLDLSGAMEYLDDTYSMSKEPIIGALYYFLEYIEAEGKFSMKRALIFCMDYLKDADVNVSFSDCYINPPKEEL